MPEATPKPKKKTEAGDPEPLLTASPIRKTPLELWASDSELWIGRGVKCFFR